MAPSLRSSSSSSTSAAATSAAAGTGTTTIMASATASRSSSAVSSSSSNGRKQSAIGIGSYVKTRQKNFTRYGQVADVVTDEDGSHLPNLWQVNLFPQQSLSAVVPTKDLTQVEHVDNIPDVFVVPSRGVVSTTIANSGNGRSSRSGIPVNEATSSIVGRTEDTNNDDQVDRLAEIFVDGYDTSSASVMDTVKAGMHFCYESIQSTLRFSTGSVSGSGSAAAAMTGNNAAEPTTAVGREKTKGPETETETQERPTKMARLIRDTECSLCCEEMMSTDDDDNTDDNASVLATFPCGHALHVRCFMLWHDQNQSKNKPKRKKKPKNRHHHHNISKSVSCPTCLQDFSLGPDDGPFGR